MKFYAISNWKEVHSCPKKITLQLYLGKIMISLVSYEPYP